MNLLGYALIALGAGAVIFGVVSLINYFFESDVEIVIQK